MVDGEFLLVWQGLRSRPSSNAYGDAVRQMRAAAKQLDKRFPPKSSEHRNSDGTVTSSFEMARDVRVVGHICGLGNRRRLDPKVLGEAFADLHQIYTEFREEFQ